MSRIKHFFKKNFIDHFFDFFMLFAAVSLGFFVDNYRDNQNEKKIAHEIAGNLIQDIASDTINIKKVIHKYTIRLTQLDSLYQLTRDKNEIKEDTFLYKYLALTNEQIWFEHNNNTINMAVDAGFLSYFPHPISNQLTAYENESIKSIELLIENRNQIQSKIFPLFQHLFKTENFISLTKQNKFICKPEIRNWNIEVAWLFSNYIVELKHANQNIIVDFESLLLKGRKTISLLKNEYNI